MKKLFAVACLLLFACSSAQADQYWFKVRVPAQSVSVIYLDTINCAGLDALGCYEEPFQGFGVIMIKRGLPPDVEQCVLKHERHHADGYDHLSGRQSFIDCGDGNWIEYAVEKVGTLENVKYAIGADVGTTTATQLLTHRTELNPVIVACGKALGLGPHAGIIVCSVAAGVAVYYALKKIDSPKLNAAVVVIESGMAARNAYVFTH